MSQGRTSQLVSFARSIAGPVMNTVPTRIRRMTEKTRMMFSMVLPIWWPTISEILCPSSRMDIMPVGSHVRRRRKWYRGQSISKRMDPRERRQERRRSAELAMLSSWIRKTFHVGSGNVVNAVVVDRGRRLMVVRTKEVINDAAVDKVACD